MTQGRDAYHADALALQSIIVGKKRSDSSTEGDDAYRARIVLSNRWGAGELNEVCGDQLDCVGDIVGIWRKGG